VTIEQSKAAALEQLLAGPWVPERSDPRAPAVHLLKSDGVPIVSREVRRGDEVRTEHRLTTTDLSPDQIKAARSAGLTQALRWHRSEPPSHWPALVKSIPCPFARDEAKEYLAGITVRMQTTGH